MLRAAIVEKSKEHREYIRASLTGINMDIQVSEYADEYDLSLIHILNMNHIPNINAKERPPHGIQTSW